MAPRAPVRVLLLLVAALEPRVARAESRLFVSLNYDAAAALEKCPDEAAFRTTIADQLGYDPFRPSSPLRVVTQTRAAANGIVGTIEWYDESGGKRGERELRSERSDCAAFTRTMAFAVAVQIQLFEQEISAPPAQSEPPRDAEIKPPPKKAPQPPSPSTPTRSAVSKPAAFRFIGGVGFTGELGSLPGLVPSGRLFVGVRRAAFGVELGGEASLPGRHVDGSGDGFEHQRAAGVLGACGYLGPVSPCLVGKVGRLRVAGVGVDVSRSPTATTGEVGARLALSPELGRFAPAIRVEALAPLVPWQVTLNGREAFRASPVVISLGADVGAFFQ